MKRAFLKRLSKKFATLKVEQFVIDKDMPARYGRTSSSKSHESRLPSSFCIRDPFDEREIDVPGVGA